MSKAAGGKRQDSARSGIITRDRLRLMRRQQGFGANQAHAQAPLKSLSKTPGGLVTDDGGRRP